VPLSPLPSLLSSPTSFFPLSLSPPLSVSAFLLLSFSHLSEGGSSLSAYCPCSSRLVFLPHSVFVGGVPHDLVQARRRTKHLVWLHPMAAAVASPVRRERRGISYHDISGGGWGLPLCDGGGRLSVVWQRRGAPQRNALWRAGARWLKLCGTRMLVPVDTARACESLARSCSQCEGVCFGRAETLGPNLPRRSRPRRRR
jgi:hypothetical protein